MAPQSSEDCIAQPSHAVRRQMGALDAYGSRLPGTSVSCGPYPTNIRTGTSHALPSCTPSSSSSSGFPVSFTHPHAKPQTHHHRHHETLRKARRVKSSLVDEDEDEDEDDGDTETETEIETEAEPEEGECTTTDDEPTIRPGSIYSCSGDAASVYSVETVESERSGDGCGQRHQSRQTSIDEECLRPDSRASVWDTGDEGGDEGEDEPWDEDELRSGGGAGVKDEAHTQSIGARKRSGSIGSGSSIVESGTPGMKSQSSSWLGGDCLMSSP